MKRLLIFGLIVFLYILLNYWIGRNGWQLLGKHVPHLSGRVYWAIFWVVSMSYLVGRVSERVFHLKASRWLTVIGSYWLAAMFYFIIFLALLEIVRILDKWFAFLPRGFFHSPRTAPVAGAVVLLAVAAVFAYGWWNARNPVVRHYAVTIPKSAGNLEELKVVAVSDLHLGTIVHNGRLVKMAEMIQRLQPDLILLPGDIVDEDPGPFIEQDMKKAFAELAPVYGIYAVPGNHEYIGGQWDKIFKHLQEAGVRVLRDQTVKVGESFFLVGRDDSARTIFQGGRRKELKHILADIDHSLPVILLDHKPDNLEEASQAGVDLQLSGHTHRGQFFPNNLITRRLFEVDWGYLSKENLQVIVSSGFGTWGPPIRVGSRAEILEIDIQFKPD